MSLLSRAAFLSANKRKNITTPQTHTKSWVSYLHIVGYIALKDPTATAGEEFLDETFLAWANAVKLG